MKYFGMALVLLLSGCVSIKTCNLGSKAAVDKAVRVAVDQQVEEDQVVMSQLAYQCNQVTCMLLASGNNLANKYHAKFIPMPTSCKPILQGIQDEIKAAKEAKAKK